MSKEDVVRQIARKTLICPSSSEAGGHWLWDRALRILQNIEHICRLPELADRAISIDRFCLIAAGYFSDAGLTCLSDKQKSSQQGAGIDAINADGCYLSVQVVSEKLGGVVAEERIDMINAIIKESFNRLTDSAEAMILSDARGLEDLGVAGLLSIFRRQFMDGKGISDIVKSWKRKIEYGYWHARLTEGFRFDAVRQIAKERFAAAEAFMDRLAMENSAGDLGERLLQATH